MPFAIVNGEPVTQMPKDLYIPPQAMEVFLEAFEGPLDLLLYLIRRQNLNILDIPLAEITRQYIQYIEVMTELQLELAGEYMVMAATLAEIKSRMLLPRPKVDAEGNEEDPRAELVRRLQEYERFKRAAESIDALPRLERDVWTTSAELKDRKVVRLLPTVTLQEMLIAFKDVVVRSEMFAHHHIQRERLSVRERMGDILTNLEHASFVEFIRLFRLEEGRMGVTVTFMALLELVREGLIEIVQAEPFAPIHVRAAGASRKLHVVGGNDALGVGAEGVLAADGEPAGATALAAGGAAAGAAALTADGSPAGGSDARGAGASLDASAADGSLAGGSAVAGAVVGDSPPVGLVVPPVDDELARFAEPDLDPNFVDDSDDDPEDGPLEGVDDVVDLVAPVAPEALATPEALVTPEAIAAPEAPVLLAAYEGGLTDDALSPAGLAAIDLAATDPAGTDLANSGPAETAALTEAFAAVEPLLVPGEATDAIGSTATLDQPAATFEFSPVGLAEPVSDAAVVVVDTTPLSEVMQTEASAPDTVVASELASAVEVAAPVGVAATAELVTPVDIAPPVEVAPPLEVTATAIEPPATGEPPVPVDSTVFAPPVATLESEPPANAPLDELTPLDVEYPVPAEEVASGEQGSSDDEVVSLVGDIRAAGEISLVGDESVSGGPAVEVEELAFNELPALDEARPVDQQPAANAQTVVNENAGKDDPSSPGEESDD
ncbi:MAG: segregation/condensation protein A [Proteobacteria bacterium]|nr:segregation/condensation protein A [Pseudomonadota bacterium]